MIPSQSTIYNITDVVIVGGGFAGCQAAIALGRAGHRVVLIDINETIPSLFRAEKVAREQLTLLQELGLLEDVKAISSQVMNIINIRGSRVIDYRRVEEYTQLYPTMLAMLRRTLPPNVTLKIGRVSDIAPSGDIQRLVLSNGETIEARLVVLATGYGEALRRKLGCIRRQIHPAQTICAGFTLRAPTTGFRIPALTAYGSQGDGIDYISIVPLGNAMRANLFMFTDIHDPRVTALRSEGMPALFRLFPGLESWIGDCEWGGDVSIFAVEIYQYDNVIHDGVVLIGDALRTSCPAIGNGMSCAMVDVIRLRDHVAEWLKTPGMSAAKIASFYSDSIKAANDIRTHRLAIQRRDAVLGTTPIGRLRREAHFALRILRNRIKGFLSDTGTDTKRKVSHRHVLV